MKVTPILLIYVGILPESDSKIYQLIFKVFEKCENSLNAIDTEAVGKQLQQSLRQFKFEAKNNQKAVAYNEFRIKRSILNKIKSASINAFGKENKQPIIKIQEKRFINGPEVLQKRRDLSNINLPKIPNQLGKDRLNSSSSFAVSQNQSFSMHQQSFVDTSVSQINMTRQMPNVSQLSFQGRGSHLKQQKNDQWMNIVDEVPTKEYESQRYTDTRRSYQSMIKDIIPGSSQQELTVHQRLNKTNSSNSSLQNVQVDQSRSFTANTYDSFLQNNYLPMSTKSIQNYQSFVQPSTNYFSLPHDHMSILSSQFKHEDDYKLLFKYMRIWQKYIYTLKKQRAFKKKLLQLLAAAIHFHEQNLMSKVFLSMMKFKLVKEQTVLNSQKCRHIVQRNIKRFYFQMLKVKFKELQWIKSGVEIAKICCRRMTHRRVLREWRRVIVFRKREVNMAQRKIHGRMGAIGRMMEFIGMLTMKKSQVDLVEMYGYMKTHGKVTQVFGKNVERLLVKKIGEVFQGWKRQTQKVVQFKNKVLTNIAKKCFKVLKSRLRRTQKIVYKLQEKEYHIKYQVMSLLRGNADEKIILKKKLSTMSRRHRQWVFKRFFGNWQNLFDYYTQVLRESISQTKLSNNSFIKKYFDALKSYTQTKRKLHSHKQASLMFSYQRYLYQCFSEWAQTTKRNKRLQRNSWKIHVTHRQTIKSHYLYSWIQACYHQQLSTKHRIISLKQKLFRTLNKHVAMNRVYTKMLEVCDYQYKQALSQKVIKGIKSKIEKKRQLAGIGHIIERYVSQDRQKLVLRSLKSNIILRQFVDILESRSIKHRQLVVLRKAFTKFNKGVLKLKKMKYGESKISSKIQQRLKVKIFSKMITKISRKHDLRIRLHHFWRIKQELLLRKCFYSLVNRYFDLKEKFEYIITQRALKSYSKNFYIWYDEASKRISFKLRLTKFIQNQRIRTQQFIYSKWNEQVKNKQIYLQMKKVAAILFFQNYLKQCLRALNEYTQIKKYHRQLVEQAQQQRLKGYFNGFVALIKKSTLANEVFINKQQMMLERIIQEWRVQAMKSQESVLKQQVIEKKFVAHNKYKIFKALYDYKQERVYFQEEILEKLKFNKELRMKQLICRRLVNYSRCQQELQQNYSIIKKQNLKNSKSQAFSIWSTELYLTLLEKETLIPYLKEKQHQHISQIFTAFKNYVQRKQYLTQNLASQKTKKVSSLVIQSLSALQQYSTAKKRLRLKEQLLTVQTKHNSQFKILEALFNHKLHSKQLKNLHYKTMMIHKLHTKAHYLQVWTQNFQRKLRLKPLINQAQNLCSYFLAERVFKSFTQYMNYKRNKRDMLFSIRQYREQCMNTQYKIKIFKEWKEMYLEARKLKRDKLLQKRFDEFKQRQAMIFKEYVYQNLSMNVEDMKRYKQLAVTVKKMLETNSLRKSFAKLCAEVILQQNVDQLFTKHQQNIKRVVVDELRKDCTFQKRKHSHKIQCEVFNRLRILKATYNQFQKHQQYSLKIKGNYRKTSEQYQQQLLQKSFMTLQLNLMRNKYIDSLVTKSDSHNNLRLERKLFKFLKQLLILKYKGLNVQERRQLYLMYEFWNVWRQRLEQRRYMNIIDSHRDEVPITVRVKNESGSFYLV